MENESSIITKLKTTEGGIEFTSCCIGLLHEVQEKNTIKHVTHTDTSSGKAKDAILFILKEEHLLI